MKMICRTSLFFLFLLGAFSAKAQQTKLTRYHIEVVKAKVVGILEGNDRLAVLQIEQADTAGRYKLHPQDEILVQFFYTVKPTTGEPRLSGITAGDRISARVAGTFNATTQQYDYLVFEYDVLSGKKKEASTE